MQTNDEKRQKALKILQMKKAGKAEEDGEKILKSGKSRFPLSDVQRGIWMDCLIDPDSYVYNIPFACKIKGRVDVDALKEGVNRILARHEAWRTVLVVENDSVYQEVLANAVLDFNHIDLRGENTDDETIAEKAKEFVKKKLDLQHGPLVRFALFQTEDDLFYFILSGHHIVYDGSSENLFCKELSAEYSASLNHEKSSVPDPEISFGDFVEYNLAHNESLQVKKQIEYWKSELEEVTPTEFPTDRPRPAFRSDEGGMLYFAINPELEKEIRSYAASSHVTVNVVMFAAMCNLLYLYTKSETVNIGTTVANRENEQIESLLGCFINNLVISVGINDKMSFDELVRITRDKLYGAYGNKDVPLEKLVEVLNPPRDQSRNPFYTVGFNYNPRSRLDLELEGCICEEFGLGDFVTLSDVNFQVHDDNNSLCGLVEYNRSIYDRESIQRILDHYQILLKKAISKPTDELGRLEIITDEEKQQILGEFNATEIPYSKNRTIVELFEEQVEKTPDNIALVYEGSFLTYRELNAKANSLAARIRSLSICPDDMVAIVAERSLEMVCAIFGVLKSGAAYVPMDPTYPEERIRFMMEDSKPKAVLVYDAKIDTDLPVLDLADEQMWEGAKENQGRTCEPNNLAYCIYTSGTTGKPKGVLIEHYGVNNLAQFYINEHKVTEQDKVLMFANFVFDASVTELMMGLLSGAQLHIASSELRGNANELAEYVKTNGITIALLPPAFLALANVEGLRLIITAGSESNRRIIEQNQHIPVYSNDYGPTEGTVCATFWKFNSGDDLPERIPIGKPIANKKIYIVNKETLCGIGVPGELCIGGEGLARGYLNRPELTAEKFVKNPFGDGRMYHTGDLARWLPDGNIDYLGRIDEQVKIRGFRVELGEIETRIKDLKGVTDCAVIAKSDFSGEKAIYAYITGENVLNIYEIRANLSNALPEYMIPSYMMQIECIPMTRNGKLDKKALPDIKNGFSKEYVAPTDETEKQICCIFEEILGLDQVGIKDDFFQIGGHSLKATKVVNRIEEQYGIRISFRDVFKNTTPESLAVLLKEKLKIDPKRSHVVIEKASVRDVYPMSSTQKRTFLINQLENGGITYNMPSAIAIQGRVDCQKIQECLNRMIHRHEILRTRLFIQNDELVQQVCEYHEEKVEEFDLRELSEAETEEVFNRFVRPFDLGKPPLVRIAVGHKSDYDILFLDMHHVVSDGNSISLFIHEFSEMYNGIALDTPDLQYKDYSEWMNGRDFSSQEKYWVNQFKDSIPVLDMPLDHSRPQEQSFEGDDYWCHVDARVRNGIRALCEREGITEYMVFLSGIMITLSKYSHQEDIVVGSPISGRNNVALDNMMGMFINTLAFRGYPIGTKSVITFVREMKETALKAYENQEYPFEKLVEAVNVKRDISRNPIFDVLFTFQNMEMASFELAGMKAAQMDIGQHKVAKFDLNFTVGYEDDGYTMGVEFCTSLFERNTAIAILNHSIHVLEQMIDNPEQKISKINLVTPEERKLLLGSYVPADVKAEQISCIHQLFENQVRRSPEAIAAWYEGSSITYVKLNQRANRLANYLITAGVEIGDKVAVLLDKSLEALVAILAVQKAGAAYVPVDTHYPAERVLSIVERSESKIILAMRTSANQLSEKPGVRIVYLDDEEAGIAELSGDNLNKKISPEELMYIIYTSGSTGTPKGVAVRHRNYFYYLNGIIKSLGVNEPMSFALVSTFSADLGSTNIYVPLVTGGQVHLVSYERATDPDALAEYFDANVIDAMKFVPSHFEALQSLEKPERVLPKRKIILAGEACKPEVIRKIRKQNPKVEIYNNYGPTETTVSVMCYQVPDDFDEEKTIVPLGRPIEGVKAYVLDENQNLVPQGVYGELYIGGPTVSAGYLGNPELTEKGFVPNLFDDKDCYSLYRTGDKTRWLSDGNLEILGRMDRQIKIRGYRIDPEGVEEVICRQDDIRNAAVTVKNDGNNDSRLVAYLVPKEKGGEINLAALRSSLRTVLPEYMVPALFMSIDSLPITANGKLDYGKLPEIKDVMVDNENQYEAPRNETEEMIVRVFSEILQVPKVGIDDNFFDLGGESFKSIKVVRKIDDSLSVLQLFKYPTPRQLAEYLRSKEAGTISSSEEGIVHELTPPDKKKKKVNFICIPFGGGNAITYQTLANEMPEDCGLYAVQVPGHDIKSSVPDPKPLEEVAQMCVNEIKKKVNGPIAVYGQCVGGALAIRLAALLEQNDVEVLGVFEAANFPFPRMPGKIFELWNKIIPTDSLTSNRLYKESLKMIGGGDESETEEEQEYMLKGMRHDVHEAEDFFTQALNYTPDFKKISAPISVIVGERDRGTEFYQERYHEWEDFSDTVTYQAIPRAGHFFHKHQAAELAAMMINQIDIWSQEKRENRLAVSETVEPKKNSLKEMRENPKPSLAIVIAVLISQVFSILGSSMVDYAMGIWAMGDSGAIDLNPYTNVQLFLLIPALMAFPFGGALADRIDKRKIMIVSDCFAIVGTILVVTLTLKLGKPPAWAIYLATLMGSLANSFQRPAFMAAITQIAPKRFLSRINGFVQVSESSGTFLAPMLGGFLLGAVGLKGVLIIDICTFLLSFFTLLIIRFPRNMFQRQEESFKKEIVGGWKFIIRRKSMISLVLFFAVVNLLAEAGSFLVQPILKSFTNTMTMGVIVASQSIGLFAGAMIISIWGGFERRAKGMVGFVILSGISLVIFGLRPSILFTTIGVVGIGLAMSMSNSHWQILIQSKVGIELQGRVFSVNMMLARALGPVGIIVAGRLCEKITNPLMEGNSSLANVLSHVLGSGEGRGMAIIVVLVGVCTAIWGIIGMKWDSLINMEDYLPDAVPGAIIYEDKDMIQKQLDTSLYQK